jgi:LCP family protein required for cell wall assembly
MTHSQKNTLAILAFIAAALAVTALLFFNRFYRAFASQPLGPALPIAEQTLPPTWTPAPTPTLSGLVTYAPTLSFATNTPAAKCGGPASMSILVIGADARADTYTYGLADAIRLVRVDFVTPKVTVLDFPRALWVEIPHIADNLNGQDHEFLNQAYLYGQPGFAYWNDPSGGPGLLALTLNRNFGTVSDHYIAVNMRTFANIVNALGGLEVPIKDEELAKTLGLRIGVNHLNGDQALKVVRNRSGGIFERDDHQNLVVCALREKLARPSVISKIPALIESFQDNILTDLTPEQLGQLACLGAQMPPQNIVLASFPRELFTETRIYDPVFDKRMSVVQADFNILRDYVSNFQNGTWPPPVLEVDTDEEEDAIICE